MTESKPHVSEIFLAAAFMLMLSLMLFLLTASIARAQSLTGAISGTVTSNGEPVSKCKVDVVTPDGTTVVNSTSTATNGTYTVNNLDAGYYKVAFMMPKGGVLKPQLYNGKYSLDEADLVTVTPPGTTQNIDAVLKVVPSISGKVTSSAGGPVVNCTVEAYYVTWKDHSWSIPPDPSATAETNSQGKYLLPVTSTGPYKVRFHVSDGWHFSEWYNNKDKTDPDSVYTTDSKTTANIDAVLLKGGRISGNLKYSDGSTPIHGYVVPYVYNSSTKSWSGLSDEYQSGVDAEGNYSLKPLKPGKYKVQFTETGGADDYLPFWYNQKQNVTTANVVTVSSGKTTTGINGVITLSFTGTVRRDGDRQLFSRESNAAMASAYTWNGKSWIQVESVKVLADGTYHITNLVSGTYRLCFSAPRNLWLDQWYKNSNSLGSATDITLEQGKTITINALLKWSNIPYATYLGSGFSSYSSVLENLGLSSAGALTTLDLKDTFLMSHIKTLFVNCTSEINDSTEDLSPLKNWVGNGGSLFLSDFAASKLTEVFPGHFNYTSPSEQGSIQKITASSTNADFASFMGKSVKIKYDQGGWDVIKGVSAGTTVYLKGTIHTEIEGTLTNVPLLMSFSSGKGKVFCSTFHEDVQGDIGTRLISFFLIQSGSGHSTWYLAEGCTGGGTETWVLVENPNNKSALAVLTYMGPKGVIPGPLVQLAPHSRTTVQVSKTIKNYQVSTRVDSNYSVIVERSMYGNNNQWATDSIGVTQPSKTWYLAEGSTNGGMETWILLLNPSSTAAKVSLTYMTSRGSVPGPTVTIPANTRMSISPSDTVPNTWDVSTKVVSTVPIVAERSMYWGNRREGHNSIGAAAPMKEWYLAEGSTNGGMETWILVQNPNSKAAKVSLTYMTKEGLVNGPTVSIPAKSRKSFSVSDTVPNVWDVSTKVTSDLPVVAERSMYGVSNGTRTWGSNSIGVSKTGKKWYLAEGSTNGGMETWVLVQNPNGSAAKVSLTYLTATGSRAGPTVTVPARSRVTFNAADTVPNNWNVSTIVSSTSNIVVERSMYGNNRSWATNSIGYSQ